ncbi:MAG: hydrogenase expression/formation protein HypE [Pseudomonadota bacterium]
MPPITNMDKKILLAHGSGGGLYHSLIDEVFLKNFNNPFLSEKDDGAIVEIEGVKLAFTTDSYVVKPIFFPGGDIGKLSVFGTVNDLAVMGAEPLYISCGLIIEEGLEQRILEKIALSMAQSAKVAEVLLVTGDTKVVEKGGADKIYINTAGVGVVKKDLSVKRIEAGDRIILSGNIGDHEVSVLLAREEFPFSSQVTSDLSPLNQLTSDILGIDGIKFMRDPTRGGLATTLNEIAEGLGLGIIIYEDKIGVSDGVAAVCELLGLDPLYLANEGKIIVVVKKDSADEVLKRMRKNPLGKESEIIGEVTEELNGRVCLRTKIGGTRILDMLTGEQLPRIC